jgi:hypothetical protein
MTILPSGNPLWLRNPGITQYGGDLNKKNYGGISVINALIDISAAQYSRLTADLAAVARVTPLMRLLVVTNSSTPHVAVQWCAPAWAPPVAYSDGATPPSTVYPTVTGTVATNFLVTIPSPMMDDYGVSSPAVPRIVIVTGGVWDGTVLNNAFAITSVVATKPVSITVW